MGKAARTLILSLAFIGVLLGLIIVNIGWPAFVQIVKAEWLSILRSVHITAG